MVIKQVEHVWPKHYIPILRWKQAERLALKNLFDEDRKLITPLIEITPKIFEAPVQGKKKGMKPDPARVLEDEAKNLLESWQNARFFLDLGLIEGRVAPVRGGQHPLVYLAALARSYKLSLVPLVRLNGRDEYQSAVSGILKLDGRGICLRLLAKEVLEPKFPQAVRSVLRKFELDESNVDFLLDYETFGPQNPELKTLLAKIPDLGRWRSLIVACGAFPEDLQRCEKGSTPIPRHDWLIWKNQFFDETSIQRRASFSDYTIQYGHYKEPVEHCIPSVSVRYTLENEWLIMRGEAPSTKTTSKNAERRPGLDQWSLFSVKAHFIRTTGIELQCWAQRLR